MRFCAVQGCAKKEIAKGLCPMHYWRVQHYGIPELDITSVKFWRQVQVTPGCWLWLGCLSGNGEGYGVFGCRPQHVAHRFAYEQIVGPIPEGMTLDHECHNDDPGCPGGPECLHRKCCNPDHMIVRTLPENTSIGKKTRRFCKRGHEYAVVGVYVDNRGWRRCIACRDKRLVSYRGGGSR